MLSIKNQSALKSKSKNYVIKYEKQHNLVVNWKSVLKKDFLTILKQKTAKRFWSTFKPYFSNKHAKGDADILLIENNTLIIVKQQMFSMKFLVNNYFQSITKNLGLSKWPDESKFDVFDEIDIIINKFWSHPKILRL